MMMTNMYMDSQGESNVISSDDGSLLGENVEVCHLSECTEEAERRQPMQQARPKTRKRADANAEDKQKSLVDPRKYKTKLCKNWKTTGTCPYEHTCCFAHGEVETRTVQQNNSVLSSLGYFSGIMLLAMKDDKAGGKAAKPAKKPQQKNTAALSLRNPDVQLQPDFVASTSSIPDTPTVHSPYCLPEGKNFGSESGPSSPLGYSEAHMPSYSYRMESAYPPKSPSFPGAYAPYPDPMTHYESPEYCLPVPGAYSPYPPSPLGPPLEFTPGYPSFKDADVGDDAYPSDSMYSQQQIEAHQAAMEKHPAIRNLQSGEMSQKQLQKVLHDIMYSNSNKQRRASLKLR